MSHLPSHRLHYTEIDLRRQPDGLWTEAELVVSKR